jgi:hypothetical protein
MVFEEVSGTVATEFIVSEKQNCEGKHIYPGHIFCFSDLEGTSLLAVCRADPSHVVRPCFGFQGSITFPLSSSPAGTSG